MTFPIQENQITDAVEMLSESVVTIDSTRFARDFYRVVPMEGSGSGIIFDSKGHIITNNHVVDGADRVQISLKDGRSFLGEVIGVDPATDVAIVRVEADSPLPAAKLGDSEKLKVGQMALAIGNTLGLPGGPTVSAGVVSALGRSLPGADFIFEGFIQTDAAINPGNSGGPLADLNGNVIGINTAMIPFAHGVGFAIPINTAKSVAEQIIQKGRVVRPWLGISAVSVTPSIDRRYNLGVETGALIIEVSRQSPAFEAGLRAGDVMVQIGNFEIKEMKDVLAALSKLTIGEGVSVSIVRRGSRQNSSLRLGEAPVELPMRERRRERRGRGYFYDGDR